MNKKFMSGMIFGLALGIGVGVTTPMLGAKDITIPGKTKSTKSNVPVTNTAESTTNSNDGATAKAIQELNATMKENNEQNRQIIQELNNINKKAGLGG